MYSSVNQETFAQEVLESPIPVLVYFWAPWCGLCRMSSPLLNRFQGEWGDEIKLVRVNADENFRLANDFRLKTIPTLLLFIGGELVRHLGGFQDRDDLQVALEELVSVAPALSRTV